MYACSKIICLRSFTSQHRRYYLCSYVLYVFLGRCYFKFAIWMPNFPNYSSLRYARMYVVWLYVRQVVQGSAHTLDSARLSSNTRKACFYYSTSTNILLLLIGIIGHAYAFQACLFKVANSTLLERCYCCCCDCVRVLIVQNALSISILLSYFSFAHFPPNRLLFVCFILKSYICISFYICIFCVTL